MFKKEKIGKTNIKSFKKKVRILVFLFVFIPVIIIIAIIYFSKIQIQIKNFKFSSIAQRHINKDYQITIKWYILSKIPIVKLDITKTKLERLKIKEKIKNIDIKALQDKNKFDKKMLKALKKANTDIKELNLDIEIGTENAALTSIIVPAVSTVIAIILRKKMKNQDNKTFIIKPQYLNQNLLNISLSGIFELKINHIINIIYILNKKEGVKKYERTSNRRSYDYSYE